MINFHKSTAAGFAAGLFTGVLAMSAPAWAGGAHGPHIEPGPVILSGSTTGRAVGSWDVQPVGSTCSISSRPIASTSGKAVGYRRVQVCN
jgi:hypothetical protein